MLCLLLSRQADPFYPEVSLDSRYINNSVWLFSTSLYIPVMPSSQPLRSGSDEAGPGRTLQGRPWMRERSSLTRGCLALHRFHP